VNRLMRDCILHIRKNKCLHLLKTRGLPIPILGICKRCNIVVLKEIEDARLHSKESL